MTQEELDQFRGIPDNVLMGATIFGEALKGDHDSFDEDGISSAWTMKNRSLSKKRNYHDVILSPGAYYSVGGNEFNKFINHFATGQGITKDEEWYAKRALQLAKSVAQGTIEDPTGGATFMFKESDPQWGDIKKKIGKDSVDPGNNYYVQTGESKGHKYFKEMMRPTATQEKVMGYQSLLEDAGYDPGPIDGRSGERTRAAVIKFQQDNGLVADGIVGKNTMNALMGREVKKKSINNNDLSLGKVLGNIDFNIVDSRNKGISNNRQVEFYFPDEINSPSYGKPTIEIFNNDLSDKELNRTIKGELLHYLPYIDNEYKALKDEFIRSINKDQIDFAKKRYQYDVNTSGEKRSFDKWMGSVWEDALIRGYVTPDKEDQFRKGGAYTKDQEKILNKIVNYINK